MIPDRDFETFWYAWYCRIRCYSRQFAGLDDEDREEVSSDILLLAWQRRQEYRQQWALSTWLYRLARNHLIDCQRCLASRRTLTHDQPRDQVDVSGIAPAGSWASPEFQCLKEETRSEVRQAIEAMESLDRQLVWLVYGDHLTLEQAAGICRLPTGTVKSRLSRARARLKGLLEETHE